MQPNFDLLKSLIYRESVTPNDAGCMHDISEFLNLPALDLSIGDTCNTYLETGIDGPLLIFLGHTDVVSPGEISAWQSDPFKLTVKQNNLYGRGIVDMKGAIWAFCHALKNHTPQHMRIGVLLTSDEEGSGKNGIQSITSTLIQKNIIPSWLLVGEPTSENTIGDTYKSARRGSAHFDIKLKGQQGHTAYPLKAKDPSKKLHQLLTLLESLRNQFPKDDLSIYHLQTSSSVGNIIPQSIHVKINLRFSHIESYQSICNELQQLDPEVTSSISAHPYQSSCHSFEEIIIKSAITVTGAQPKASNAGGTSDARWFSEICPNIVEYGLRNITAHQCNEHCSKDDLVTLFKLYQQILIKLDQANNPDKINDLSIKTEDENQQKRNEAKTNEHC